MSIKLKALGVGLLAMVAAGAIAVMNASAESSATGHFTCEVSHCILDVSDTLEPHQLELVSPGLTGIVCNESSYEVTVNAATVTQITAANPKYGKCHTTGDNTIAHPVTIEMNGCDYVFTQPNKESVKTEHTVSLVCPAGKTVILHHEGCEITIDPVEHIKGVGYTTIVQSEKHAITLTAEVTGFTETFHAGFCLLLGTSHPGELKGSATITGTDTLQNPVGITATGSVN